MFKVVLLAVQSLTISISISLELGKRVGALFSEGSSKSHCLTRLSSELSTVSGKAIAYLCVCVHVHILEIEPKVLMYAKQASNLLTFYFETVSY